MTASSWIDLRHDADAGIESVHAHFKGHAYDPHWHDSYLIGYTQQGIQQFHCRRSVHSSTPGQVFMLEPGEVHDGEAVAPDGFTYASLMIDPQWIERELRAVFAEAPEHCLPGFASTLQRDPGLTLAVMQAHRAVHEPASRMVRQTALDALLIRLSAHLQWRTRCLRDPRQPAAALRARDYLHDHVGDDVGLDNLAAAAGVDRFRLTRAFKAAFGLAPHAYLVQLRLARARRMLAAGATPADAAAALGFSDQSHLGRWFRRAYGMTPAAYRMRCSNVPDAP